MSSDLAGDAAWVERRIMTQIGHSIRLLSLPYSIDTLKKSVVSLEQIGYLLDKTRTLLNNVSRQIKLFPGNLPILKSS